MNDDELARQVSTALKELFPGRDGHADVSTSSLVKAPLHGGSEHRGSLLTVGATVAAAALVAGIAVTISLSADSSSPAGSGSGVVIGLAPVCYGPGPDLNLKPITVIRAVRADGLSRSVTVHTSNARHTYRMILPAGNYKISAYSGAIHVTVRANATTRHANLPQPGCL